MASQIVFELMENNNIRELIDRRMFTGFIITLRSGGIMKFI